MRIINLKNNLGFSIMILISYLGGQKMIQSIFIDLIDYRLVIMGHRVLHTN